MAKRLYIQLQCARTGESITLPVNPEQIEIPNEKDIPTYNILNYGEISVIGRKVLKRVSLAKFLPDNESFLALLASLVKQLDYKPYSLKETVDMLNRWVDDDEIIRLIIPDYLNDEFRIQKFTQIVRESTSDLDYTIDLIEYRNPQTPKTEGTLIKNKWAKLKERLIRKYVPEQLIGQKGQTIYKIAKLTYGAKWQELADKNKISDANKDMAGEIIEMLPIE